MDDLTDRERKALLDAAKRIRTYKLMQGKGYERLAKKAKDERTNRLLAEISADEFKDSEHWSQKIEELGGERERLGGTFFIDRRVGLMMRILGTRGFFEWATIAEDESVEDLAIQAGNINHVATSEAWSRMASDERLHIERVKKEAINQVGYLFLMRYCKNPRCVMYRSRDMSETDFKREKFCDNCRRYLVRKPV